MLIPRTWLRDTALLLGQERVLHSQFGPGVFKSPRSCLRVLTIWFPFGR